MEPLKGPGDRKKYDMVKKYIYIIFLLIFSSNTTSGHYPLSLYRIEQHEHSPKYLLLCSAEKVKCLRGHRGTFNELSLLFSFILSWYSEDCLRKERVMSHELCVRHLYSGCRGNCHGSDLLSESHRN